MEENNFLFDDHYTDSINHPQKKLLYAHIERAVQDLFLDSLRNEKSELVHIFTDVNQIDYFIKKILRYWESTEDYEICAEVLNLSKEFKKNWHNKENRVESLGIARIKEILKNDERLL